EVQVEAGHLPGRLLDVPGLAGERFDLDRAAGQRGMLADHDARRCLVAGDELAAEITEPDRLLPHGIVLLVTVAGAVRRPRGSGPPPCAERDDHVAAPKAR